ncbi:MAG TPA: hypothetical protein VF173_29490 [Thermoanaerobaculia bacterium]|nr:hypothetical protein [Thermoanaerobaculia bacterium]
MRPSPQEALNRWLAAEREGRSEEADAALRETFAALPLLSPAAGFAGRVLVRAGLQPEVRDVFASRALRLVLAASLVSLALGVFWVPPVLGAFARLWSLGGVVRLGTWAVEAGSQALATLLGIGEWLFALYRSITEPLLAPQVLAGLTVCLLVSGLALRFLRDQLTGERSWNHVDPTL